MNDCMDEEIRQALLAWAERCGGLAEDSKEVFINDCSEALNEIIDGFGMLSQNEEV